MVTDLKYKVGADVSELQQGMQEGSQSVQAFEEHVDDLNATIQEQINNTKTLRQEQKAAMVHVQKMTAAYAKLTKEEKNSNLGQEMARQLHEAEEQAAALVDATGDLNSRIRIMSSDTRNLDILKDTFDAVGSSVTSVLSGIAVATGKQEDFNKAIAAYAGVQSTVNTVTKIANLLNKDSSLMIGIQTLQYKALSKAKELDAKATGKATIAQRVFNAVAKANPYVLLAIGVGTLITALTAYGLFANKATSATEKMNKAMHDASVQGQKDAQKDIVQIDLLYKASTNDKLGKEERLKATKKLIDQYPTYFSNMSTEQVMLGEASKAYQQLKEDIIAVAKAKAYQGKIEELAKENVELEDQIEKQEKLVQETRRLAQEQNKNSKGPKTSGGAVPSGDFLGTIEINKTAQKEQDLLDNLNKKKKENIDLQNKYIDKINDTSDAIDRLEQNEDERNKKNKPVKTNTPKSTVKNDIKYTADSLAALENEFQAFQTNYKNGLLKNVLPEDYRRQVEDFEKRIKDKKIELGLELPETTEQKLKNEIARLQTELAFTLEGSVDEAEIKRLISIYQQRLEKEQARLKVEPELEWTEQDQANLDRQVNDILSGINPDTYFDTDFDFSGLSDTMKTEADKTVEQMNRIKTAIESFKDMMNDPDASDRQIAEAQKQIDVLLPQYDKLKEKATEFNNASTEGIKWNKTMDNLKSAIGNVGSAFSSLSQITEDETFNTAGVIAQAVANLSLSFADAMKNHKSFTVWDWIATGTMGLAQLLTMISSIKSAQGYAEGGIVGGGIVPGHSKYGDKIFARLNSGEGVFTEDQMKRIDSMIDQNTVIVGQQTVHVVGKIRGKDILIVAENNIKEMNKSGKNISFG